MVQPDLRLTLRFGIATVAMSLLHYVWDMANCSCQNIATNAHVSLPCSQFIPVYPVEHWHV